MSKGGREYFKNLGKENFSLKFNYKFGYINYIALAFLNIKISHCLYIHPKKKKKNPYHGNKELRLNYDWLSKQKKEEDRIMIAKIGKGYPH